MKIKKLGITILMVIIVMSSLFAATPSKFEVGVLNYYKIQDLADTEFTTYTPGIRFVGNLTPWFGLGLETLLEEPFVDTGTSGVYNFVATTDVNFRVPLGFFEPFLAFGPVYTFSISDAGFGLDADVAYSGRVGFDFNITPVFTLGLEGKLVLVHIPNIIDGTQAIDWLDSTYVGLTLKVKI